MQLALLASHGIFFHPIVMGDENGSSSSSSSSSSHSSSSSSSSSHSSSSSYSSSSSSSSSSTFQKQEDYWKEHLGENTKMPKAIKDSMNGMFLKYSISFYKQLLLYKIVSFKNLWFTKLVLKKYWHKISPTHQNSFLEKKIHFL